MRFLVFIVVLAGILVLGGLHYPTDPALDQTAKFDRKYTLVSSFPFLGSYLLFEPSDRRPGKTYPLVVTLHGGYKRSLGAYVLSTEQYQERFQSYILMPIAPFLPRWADAEDGGPNSSLDNAIEMIEKAMQENPIDPERIYLTGSSAGAVGTYAATAHYPDLFAASVPVNGVWIKKDAKKLAQGNMWIYHGELDPNFPIKLTRRLITAIKRQGGDPKFTMMKNVGHDSRPAYLNLDLWQWLFSQRKSQS